MMEKTEITLTFDSERLQALTIYLKQENSTVQKRMEDALRQLYEEKVPEPVREYLDARTAPQRPKRPPRPSQPKTESPKTPADTVKEQKEETGP